MNNKENIENTIEKIRIHDLPVFATTINDAIKSWETYKVLQENILFFGFILHKKFAISAFNAIQYSLITSAWMSLSKLWGDKTRWHNNIVFSTIYTLIKPKKFFADVSQIYNNDELNKKTKENIKIFVDNYNKNANGAKKFLHEELEKIRDNYIAHAGEDYALTYKHTLHDLDELYKDSIAMIESLYVICNSSISFKDVCHSYHKQAENLVDILRPLMTEGLKDDMDSQ